MFDSLFVAASRVTNEMTGRIAERKKYGQIPFSLLPFINGKKTFSVQCKLDRERETER